MQGAKVSKSRGNAVDPIELVRKYSVDSFRYFLLREVTLGLDGAFSEDLLAERYTTDLANDLGNLWFRLASMLGKYFDGRVPEFTLAPLRYPLLTESFTLMTRVAEAMEKYDPRQALSEVFGLITKANQFVEENKPWSLAKDPAKKDELAAVLGHLAECVAHAAVALIPFLPSTAPKILKRLGLPEQWTVAQGSDFEKPFLKPGTSVDRGEALFPRLEEIPEKSM
jgi:methionyl-tRNA synthetase